jgi:hypothetical protein
MSKREFSTASPPCITSNPRVFIVRQTVSRRRHTRFVGLPCSCNTCMRNPVLFERYDFTVDVDIFQICFFAQIVGEGFILMLPKILTCLSVQQMGCETGQAARPIDEFHPSRKLNHKSFASIDITVEKPQDRRFPFLELM